MPTDLDLTPDPRPPAPARRIAPEAVWVEVRRDYIEGMSAPECCRRHGVGLTALRERAAREGWRRLDQPWTPPGRLDPWDEGTELEARVAGDLNKVGFNELSYVAHRRMMRAVMRGDAVEALRWRRVRLIMDDEEAEIDRALEAHEAMRWHRATQPDADDPVDPVDPDASDGVLQSAALAPGETPDQAR